MSVGDELKNIRINKGFSLREAARRSGLSHSYIDSVEKGVHPKTKSPISPSPETLRSLSKAYNYEYEELMKIAGYLDREPGSQIQEEETQLEKERKYASELFKKITDPDKKKAAIEVLKGLANEKK